MPPTRKLGYKYSEETSKHYDEGDTDKSPEDYSCGLGDGNSKVKEETIDCPADHAHDSDVNERSDQRANRG